MILCLGTTPAAQRVMIFPRLNIDQVNRASKTLDGAAGKSINVAKVLQTLGHKPLALGFVGGVRGREIHRLLQERGVKTEFVEVLAPTRECVTVIDEAAGTITELVEESRSVDAGEYGKLLDILERRLPGTQALVLSGTIASGGPADLYYRCAAMAREAGVPAILDASGRPLLEALPARPMLVKPNRAELEATIGRTLRDVDSLKNAIRDLHTRGAESVVITAGAGPALAFDGDRFWQVTSPRVRALNPIGSGDAFTAGLVDKLVGGCDLVQACRWAAGAGAANAMTCMAGELDRHEVERLASFVDIQAL